VAVFDVVTDLITAPLETAIGDSERQLTVSLRVMAASSGWPIHLVNSLRVAYDDGHFVPAYPRESQAAIEDLEYGVTGEPNPVLRRFLNRSQAMADLTIARKLAKL
jgi:hypothetical protein